MFFSGANFNLHLAAIRGRTLRPYRDAEFGFYAVIVVSSVLMICAVLILSLIHIFRAGQT